MGGGWTNYRVFHLWCITTPSSSLINDYMYRNVLFPLCHLLITLANGLDQDKDRQAVCHSDIVSEKVNF